MLIKVFDSKWFNPHQIMYLLEYPGNLSRGVGTYIRFTTPDGKFPIAIDDKTQDEVAAEINKQLKEGE